MRPITAQPGYTTADADALLASRVFVYADVYTITPLVGLPLRYTTAQNDVTVVPVGSPMRVTYKAKSLLISGLKSHTKIGTDVDTQTVKLEYDRNLEYQARLPFAKALLQGLLDGASITRDRFIAPAWGAPWVGGMPMFKGLVANVDTVGRQTATVNVKSDLVLLNAQMPKTLATTNCQNVFGDANCSVNLASLAVIGAVGASPGRSYLPWSSSSAAYSLGKVYIDNFDSVTRIRTVAKADASGIHLIYPLDFDPTVGQNFTVYPGCPRTLSACQGFLPSTWQQRYRGQPFTPVAETAL